jgi:osmotically inducible protein OsmC
MSAVHQATVIWEGSLASGKGEVSADTSKAFTGLPVTWASRTGSLGGLTSPEELIAAAHASCYAMALSGGLSQMQKKPEKLEVTAAVTFDRIENNWRIVSSALKVRGIVPGLDSAAFVRAAEAAKVGCPVSQALKGNVAVSLEATLLGP